MSLFNIIVIAALHETLLLTVSSENVETRIHKLITPEGFSKSGFGTSLEVDQKTKLLLVGAPKLGDGGFFKCGFSFNEMNNGTSTCSASVTYDDNSVHNMSVGSTMTNFQTKAEYFILVCGSQNVFSCPDLEIVQRMIGKCYSYSLKTDKSTTLLTPCPFKCPQGLVADLVFVLDGSGSVNYYEFQSSLKWVLTVLEQFSYDIDAKNLEVGYVIYENRVSDYAQPKPRSFYDLKADITKIDNPGGGTATHLAIDRARGMLTSAPRKVTKIMITVTDGESNNPTSTSEAASRARDAGIVMIAVGVGNGIGESELQNIANGNIGDSTRVMTVADYSNLNEIVSNLSQVIKESASGSLEGTSSNSSTELTNCQLGSSMTATSTGFFVGAVGSFDRIGTVAEYKDIDSFPQSVSTGHLNDTEIAAMLGTTTSQLKDSYFGYSVTSGDFTKDGAVWITTSGPRFLSRGLVLIYQSSSSYVALRPSDISGLWQLGGYYGHSVLATDINKDGYDDLLVSAPLFSNQDKYDSGIVFVYMNDKSSAAVNSWTNPGFSPVVLTGSGFSGSRFGMAIVNGGDIDKNGYEDIIIGAPYEKDSTSDRGSGAIYIYFATSRGLDSTAKQRITSRAVSSSTQTFDAFGYAIRGGIDIDNNNYPDVIVAAPSTDGVVLLRSRKIIDLELQLSLSPSTINVLNCGSNLLTACSTVRVCYSAKYNDNTATGKIFAMSVNVTLDSLIGENVYKRFIFTDSRTTRTSENSIQVGSSLSCRRYSMQLNMNSIGKANSGGFDTVPRVEVRVDMAESHKNQQMSGVLSSVSQNTKTADWTFEKGCAGKNRRCEHDLVIKANYSKEESPTPLLLDGNSNVFIVSCSIENKGPHHAHFLRVNISSGNLAVLRVLGGCAVLAADESDSTNGVTIIKYQSQSSTAVFKDLMRAGETCNFTIEFDFAKLEKSANETSFKIHGLIHSNAGGENVSFDGNPTNNEFSYKQDVQYKSVITLTPLSIPKNVAFYPSNNTNITTIRTLQDDILGGGKTKFAHKYSIYNQGPLGLANAKAKISWPEKTENGYNLLYLIDVTCEPEESCKCNKMGKANKMKIPIEDSLVPSDFKKVTVQYPSDEFALKSPNKIKCSNSRCDYIFCDLNYVGAFKKVTISAHYLPWVPTFSKNFTTLDIYSSYELLVANTTPETVTANEMVGTTMTSLDVFKPTPVPEKTGLNIGAIIGAIIGGIVLLVIAVLIMWKAGFFKSKYGNMTREARKSVKRVRESKPEASQVDVVGIETTDPQMGKSTEQLS